MGFRAIFFVLLFFQATSLAAADNYATGDILYVWAKSGLNMRSGPSIKASKIERLDDGSSVEILSISEEKYDILELKPFEDEDEYSDVVVEPYILTGTWVKVKSGKMIGYVIDIYLMRFPLPKSKQAMVNLFIKGATVVRDTSWSLSCDSEGDCEEGITEYSNGVRYEYIQHSAGSDESCSIPNLGLEEAYIMFTYRNSFSQDKYPKEEFRFSHSKKGIYVDFSDLCYFSIRIENGVCSISSGCSC